MIRVQRLRPVLLTACLLVAGCNSLIGGPRETPTIYAPEPVIQPDPGWPAVTWSLSIARPAESRMGDSQRIVVSPVPGELQVYRAALWARTPAEMVEDAALRTLEDSGRIPVVARQGSGAATDYRLLLDVRTFKADYAGHAAPSAIIEVNAQLVQAGRIVASRSFRQVAAASGTDVARVADAFAQALGPLGHDIAGWALQTGR